ncbi:Protein involved in mRNA turnover and stability [Handroanthus impetiginosus]|uniref:Protein involved in mRNA turnover and stability n=1 Tax=Handroanthus impetiginosus TaxID=429701 RepID=A0A2G9HI99_9LAMI|nr:Protein involved in mRNA turnover and stability [Handroanthus impetiginosus]
MGEHLLVSVNQLPKSEGVEPSEPVPQAVGSGPNGKKPDMVGSSSSMAVGDDKVVVVVDNEEVDEEAPLIGMGECRICQEEDTINNLESPCACSGSLKYAHRKCVQHWCNEKGDITCEICHQPYQPGYTAPPRPPPDETTIDIGGVWQISGTPLDMHDPRLIAIAEAERQLFEADYDDYNGTNSSGAAFCRSAALILMALLLLRHALSITDDGNCDGGEDASTFFSLFLLRAVGFLLPCYIMIWAISILQRRRQRQEAAALAATQFAIVVQSAQSRGLLVAPAAPAVAPQATPSQATPHQENV